MKEKIKHVLKEILSTFTMDTNENSSHCDLSKKLSHVHGILNEREIEISRDFLREVQSR